MAGLRSPQLQAGGEHAPYLTGGGGVPSGAAGGALEGVYPNPGLAAGAVTAAKLAANSVTSAAILNETIVALDIAPPSAAAAAPAEGAVAVNAASVVKKVSATLKGNAVKKSFVVVHGLKTRLLLVTIQLAEGGLPGKFEVFPATFAELKAISENEMEVIFVAAPAAGAVVFVNVAG